MYMYISDVSLYLYHAYMQCFESGSSILAEYQSRVLITKMDKITAGRKILYFLIKIATVLTYPYRPP
jgi:hypothetical protein